MFVWIINFTWKCEIDERKKVIVHDKKNIMHEMFKFNYRNTSTNISITNHILNDED